MAERFLGEGNTFVLGSIGSPELLLVVDQCKHLLSLWFWLGAVTTWLSKEVLDETDPTFGKDYFEAARRQRDAVTWTCEQHNRLLAEYHAERARSAAR